MLKSAAEVQEKTQSILGEIVQQKQLKNEMNEKTGVVKQNADLIEVSMGEQKKRLTMWYARFPTPMILYRPMPATPRSCSRTPKSSKTGRRAESRIQLSLRRYGAVRHIFQRRLHFSLIFPPPDIYCVHENSVPHTVLRLRARASGAGVSAICAFSEHPSASPG
jgi:hypothetical protein